MIIFFLFHITAPATLQYWFTSIKLLTKAGPSHFTTIYVPTQMGEGCMGVGGGCNTMWNSYKGKQNLIGTCP